MIEKRHRAWQAGAHRRQLGLLDQELLARMMDENSQRPQPWTANAVLREALVRLGASRMRNARKRSGWGPT
jgi:hypothetical protein